MPSNHTAFWTASQKCTYVNTMCLPTCPARSRIGINSAAILQFSLVTRVTAAPERLEKRKETKKHHKLMQEQLNAGSKVCKHALLPCSASAAHAMDILLYVTWEVKVEDMSYVMDIQPSRRQVRGH